MADLDEITELLPDELGTSAKVSAGIAVLIVLILAVLAYDTYMKCMWNECVRVHSETYCSLRGYGKGL